MFSLFRWGVSWAALAAVVTLAATAGRAEKVTGTVSDEAGKPVSGAAVHLTRMANLADFRYVPGGDVTTDAAGHFSADVEPSRRPGTDSGGKPFPPFYGWATVSASGFAAAQRLLKVGENAFTLKPGATIRGNVTDAAGKPVAGAVASISFFYFPNGNGGETIQTNLDEKVTALFEAKTGADGAFAIGNLPMGWQGSLELKNPEYAYSQMQFKAGAPNILALQARPTAVISGKVVDEQGKPKVDVIVQAIATNGFTSGTTGPDGAYRITHLATGMVAVYVHDPKKECVAVAQNGVAVAEGKTTTLPDFIATEGAMIEASFVDDDTGKPIIGLMIAANGPQMPTNRTSTFSEAADDKGVCRVRVAPGENSVRVGSSSEEYPKAYQTPSQIVKVERGKTVSLTFRLRKGVSIAGVVVGEDDKPLPGVHLRLLPDGWNYEFDREPGEPTDAAGKWKQTGIERDGRPLKFFIDPKYEVVSPLTVTLDPKDLTPAALMIKVKRIETRSVAGRIVTADGQPIRGTNVSISAYERSDGRMKDFISKNVSADAEGRYHLDTLRPNHSTVSINADPSGYRYLSGGEQTKSAEGYAVSDIVMTPLNVAASGKVTDAKGKPIAGARVWCVEGLPEASAVTGADGKFALKGLPADGPASITAMTTSPKGSSLARLVVKMRGGKADSGGMNALLLTPEPIPVASESALIARIAESLKQKAKGSADWFLRELLRSMARRDPNAALRLIPEGGKDEDRDQNRFAVLESFARSGDPAKVAEWSGAQVKNFSTAEWRCCAESELAILLASTRPDLANRFYDDALEILVSATDPFNFARMIAASALLHRGDGEKILTRLQGMKVESWLGSYGMARIYGTIGRGDGALAEKLIDTMAQGDGKDAQAYAYARLLRTSLPTSPKTAVRLLEKMRSVVTKGDYGGEFELARATRLVIRALGPTDPETALKLARELPPSDGANNLRPAIMAMAASFQKGETAKTAWNECLALVESSRNREPASLAAEIACQVRAFNGPPEIAQTLWQKSVKELNIRSTGAEADFIYYAGFFDPAMARMYAEQTFDRSINAPLTSRQSYPAATAAGGLASSDPEYALTLIDRTPPDVDGPEADKEFFRFSAQLKLAQILLMPPQRRLAYLRYDTGNEFWETD